MHEGRQDGIYSHQELLVVEKDEAGEASTRKVLDVAFVPLTGDCGAALQARGSQA